LVLSFCYLFLFIFLLLISQKTRVLPRFWLNTSNLSTNYGFLSLLLKPKLKTRATKKEKIKFLNKTPKIKINKIFLKNSPTRKNLRVFSFLKKLGILKRYIN